MADAQHSGAAGTPPPSGCRGATGMCEVPPSPSPTTGFLKRSAVGVEGHEPCRLAQLRLPTRWCRVRSRDTCGQKKTILPLHTQRDTTRGPRADWVKEGPHGATRSETARWGRPLRNPTNQCSSFNPSCSPHRLCDGPGVTAASSGAGSWGRSMRPTPVLRQLRASTCDLSQESLGGDAAPMVGEAPDGGAGGIPALE